MPASREPRSPPAPPAVVAMGVTGAGKTTAGRLLAQALGADFLDGDDLHTDAVRAKMRAGVPLHDSDRGPWLDRIAAALHADADPKTAIPELAAKLARA